MAAAITTVSTTLEGQMLEVANALASAEKLITEPPIPNRIAITPGYETNEIAINCTLPATYTAEGSGFLVEAEEYID